MQRYLLYVFDESSKANINIKPIDKRYKMFEFKPSLLKLKLTKFTSVRDLIIHVLWFVFTRGKYRIIYVKDGSKIVHSSYVIPKIFKFSFMESKNDFEIGPSYTEESYRGQGIYPFVLTYIVSKYNRNSKFYMIVEENNTSSQRGIIKSGFKKIGEVYKDKFGIYRRIIS